ncbi:hypothetical protein [Nocardioides jiangxiensis]|uniref:Peptidase MA superfamily protein n=1 Tax=Nocardioides jiangxiensis TaxID=3064524 RepID=A0ABT9B6Q6_9ACTN|nr:hypothetical protein [Nocardioides sp. WY-20]MDO7869282.1 hypothetical protein [Nocardioides sp. WY-20]
MPRLPVLLATLAVLAGCGSQQPVRPPTVSAIGDGAAIQALADLSAALATGDTAGAAAADRAVAGAESMGVTVDDVRFVDDDPSLTATLPRGRVAVVADMTWRVDGFDAADAHAEVTVLMERAGDGARIVGFGGGKRPEPLWLTGPLVVRRTPGVLVAGADPATVTRVDRLARTAQTEVRDALGTVTPLVVEVPASSEALDATLGAESGQYAAIAAVTTFEGADTGRRTPVHVFVNPGVLGRLKQDGAQLVMTHEVTHLATDAVHAKAPLWLLEGYADHVALLHTALPLRRTAGQIAAQVRKDGVPTALPGATDFDAHATHLGAVYESAWRVVEVLAAAGGESALHELYRRTAAGEPVGTALRALYGFGEEELTRRWQADLRRISHLSPTAG